MMFIIFLLFHSIYLYASDMGEITVDTNKLSELSISTPTRDICDEMIHYYFKGNGEKIRDQIKPYLQRKLQSTWKRQKLDRIEAMNLKRSSTVVDSDLEKYINKKVSQAMEEAFEEEHQIRMRYQSEVRERCSKNQVAAITAITGVVTAAIAAGVTLAIAFGT